MKKICFLASSGGHFEQLMMLAPLMKKYESFIVTENVGYKACNNEINTYFVAQINRKELIFFFKAISIFIKSFYIFVKEKPDFIISTGALCTVPMCIIAKIFKRKVIFIESFAKINSGTLSGKIVYKFADLFIVQWESLLKIYPEALYGGGIY